MNIKGLLIDVVCTEPDDLRFSRKLSAEVNQSPLYLARVMVTGRQIYPFHEAILGHADVLLRCEFRIRDGGAMVSQLHIADLLRRLASHELVDAFVIDANGAVIERIGILATART